MATDEPIVWKDIDSRMRLGGDGDVDTPKNVNAVYVSIDNILSTSRGSRVMLRSFACDFKNLLFEHMHDEHLRKIIYQNLKEGIEGWDKRVKIDFIDIEQYPDNDSILLKIDLYIRGYEKVFTYKKTFNRGK